MRYIERGFSLVILPSRSNCNDGCHAIAIPISLLKFYNWLLSLDRFSTLDSTRTKYLLAIYRIASLET